jgi:hypothetical protein
LDVFIERRAREARDAKRIEEAWAASERAHHEQLQQRNRHLWYCYHLNQAEAIEKTATQLSADHRARAEALLKEPEVQDA